MAIESVVSAGCIISGAKVKRSLLFSNVRVEVYSQVNDSVILPNVTISKGCQIRKAIIDRGCVIPEGMTIGIDHEQDRQNGFRVTNKGVVLVTRTMLGVAHGYSFEE